MRSFHKPGIGMLVTSALTYIAMADFAWAQSGNAEQNTASNTQPVPSAPSNTQTDNSIFGLEQVVVTGTKTGQDKFTAPYSITTISPTKIQEMAPKSITELLKDTPGITVEASGGEGGSENVLIRGLPWAGWRLIDLTQDGMPIYESNFEGFMNADEFFRADRSIQGAEVVRGGTAPIYGNNSSGGVVNFITNHGTATPQGVVALETGSANRMRWDGAWSGPVTDNLLVSAAGFYRRDDGLRDPGFGNGDHGGQFRVGFTYKFDQGKVWGDFTYLNDHGIFYTDIPLTDPRTGASLAGLINPQTGTLDSAAVKNVTIRTLDANGNPTTVQRDLSDGIHPLYKTATLGGDYDLGDGFKVTDTYRHTDGTLDFNGIFNGATPSDSTTFLNSQLAAAKSGFGPSVTSLRYVLAGTNTVYNTAQSDNLVMANSWDSIHTVNRYDANDVHINKTFATGFGDHDFTAGLYYSHYYFLQQRLTPGILMNVQNNPVPLDIQALNAAGAVVGNVTENGFTNYGFGQSGHLTGDSLAYYFADTWHITPSWQVDVGTRQVDRRNTGAQGVIKAVSADPTGPLAARAVSGVVSYIPHYEHQTASSYTVGTSYNIEDNLNVFARYTHTFSFPRFDTILGAATIPGSTATLPVSTAVESEVGVKWAIPWLQVYAVGFMSRFNDLTGSTQVADVTGAITTSNIIFDSQTKGVELEAVLTPFRGFDINVSGMLQDPKLDSIATLTGLTAQSQQGGEIPRVPKTQIVVEPSYTFSLSNYVLRAYARYFHIGLRFQDDSNLSELPAYGMADIGLSVSNDNRVTVRALVNNVTNEIGLTEGNARASVLGIGTVGDATVGRSIFGRNFTISIEKKF
jgi:iron complex outermembrane receptor protein